MSKNQHTQERGRQRIERIVDYGVRLERLKETDIEMVRNWRNDPGILRFMWYRKYITAEMQQRWFRSINNEFNYYFITWFMGNRIGLHHIKDISTGKDYGEIGGFIIDRTALRSEIPFRISFALIDFAFNTLNFKYIFAHILKNNKEAIRYNQFLGFKIEPGQADREYQLFKLLPSDHHRLTARYRRLLRDEGKESGENRSD